MILLGIDTGGTFTDFIFKQDDTWDVYKIPSTPSNPATAVISGIEHLVRKEESRVIHGSTVATNAILEGKGAVTALITNRGFEDVIQIGRQNRGALYDLAYQRPAPLVPAHLRFGVGGRIGPSGEVVEDLNEVDVGHIIASLKEASVESVAVSCLFSFSNPDHERRIRQILSALDIPISLSHEILAEFREFERTSTTVLNAYVSPTMQTYIGALARYIGKDNLSIMQSNGGSILADTAMEEPVRTILSGPAGGAVGAYHVGSNAGYDRLITFDMGGTSTDVALIDGALPLTTESTIGAYPVKVPMIDIHTVGAGGGSIATIDAGGALTVGPESAGADPGPICYGKGHSVTVTDANLFLGRLLPDAFLGGKMKLHPERLQPHFEEMARTTGLSPTEVAEGILSVANATMERALRVISVERGYDPREFTLLSFGGAGGMHAVFLAKLLNIPRVLVPRHPGILSAIGMMMADVIKDYSQTVMMDPAGVDGHSISDRFQPLEKKGREDLADEGVDSDRVIIEKLLDMRYRGQSYEIMVPFGENVIDAFHALHEKTYGYSNPDKDLEIVNIRVRARGMKERPVLEKCRKGGDNPPSDASIGRAVVRFGGQGAQTRLLARDALCSGNRIHGPAVIVEYSSTIVIPPFAVGSIDDYGNVIIRIGDER
ncbi:MAG: hydantoinase/oxoprolinase family protein [Desulfobacterales bacterium]